MKKIIYLLIILVAISANSTAQLNLQWEELGPDNAGGVINALIIDHRDPSRQTLYAGAGGGGVWKSTNGGNSWSYLGCAGNYAVSCMTQASDGTIYFGTGTNLHSLQFSMLGSLDESHVGNGTYKIDANDNITHISSTTANLTSGWIQVNRIAVNPTNHQVILAATASGFLKSEDGGLTWTEIVIQGIGLGQSAKDVKWSADNAVVYAVVGGDNKLARSLDGGNTWERISNTSYPGFPSTRGRIEVAIAPSNSAVAYINVATTQGASYGVFRTVDTGSTWLQIGTPDTSFNPFSQNNEGWFSNAIGVSPTNPDRVFVGGRNMYSWTSQSGWKLIGSFSDPLFEPNEHASQFHFVFDDVVTNVMYIATTKGVFKSSNVVSSFPFPTFSSKNAGLKAKNFYTIAAALNGEVMGSSNDNGTYKGSCGSQSFSRLNRDLAFCEFSQLDSNILFTENYFGMLHVSYNKGLSFNSAFDSIIDPLQYNEPSACGVVSYQNAPFINPFLLHETKRGWQTSDSVLYTATSAHIAGDTVWVASPTANTMFKYALPTNLNAGNSFMVPDPVKSRLFFPTYCGLWMKKNAARSNSAPDWYKITNYTSGRAWSFAVSADGNILYYGTQLGNIVKIEGLNQASYSSPNMIDSFQLSIYTDSTLTSRAIEGIAVDPQNSDIAIAMVAGYSSTYKPNAYKTIDGGVTWAPMQVGDSMLPAYTCVIDAHNSNYYIAGTEHGIWTSNDAGATWHQDNQNMCDVPVYRLRQLPYLEDDCTVLYAATNSRGLWRSFTLTPSGCTLNACTYPTDVSDMESSTSSLRIYPNPALGQVTAELNLLKPQPVKVFIVDLTGRIVISDKMFLPEGTQKIALDISALQNGSYIICTEADDLRHTKLLIKQE